jgi:hypothetical protein
MSEDLQSQETGAKGGLLMPVPRTLTAREQHSWENLGTSTLLDDGDPIELELVARLEGLLAKDVELSAAYEVLLRSCRPTGRERRRMRSELRLLHTEEGAILYEVKLHRTQRGRGGKWAQFLRERKPKAMSRSTADRWIRWYLNSKQQEQSPEPRLEPAPGNAPQDESGAFSAGVESQPDSSDLQQLVATDPPANDSEAFEDPKQIYLLLKKSQAARLKAAAGFLAAKLGSSTWHEAIYLTVSEAAARMGFVYAATATEEKHE